MASIRPLYPLCCPLKKWNPSSTNPSSPPIHCTNSHYESLFSSSQFSHPKQSPRQVAVSVSFNPAGNLDLSLYDGDDEQDAAKAAPPMPPKEGRYEIVIDNDIITRLDLSPFHTATGITSPTNSGNPREFLDRRIGFTINYKREDENDPRELSEYPDIRLWFVRLDSVYPWLPVVLDWRAGELARYAAMLVPHQMSMRMGVVFNPEALELFVVQKVFVVYEWLKGNEIPMPRLKAKDMAKMLGFEIGDDLFNLVDN